MGGTEGAEGVEFHVFCKGFGNVGGGVVLEIFFYLGDGVGGGAGAKNNGAEIVIAFELGLGVVVEGRFGVVWCVEG